MDLSKEVKLVPCVLSTALLSRGMEKTYEAPSNEAPHMVLGYHQGRLMTYLLYMTAVMVRCCGFPFSFPVVKLLFRIFHNGIMYCMLDI